MNKTKQTSIESIKKAIESLTAKGIKSTQANVSTETGRTIKRHSSNVNDVLPYPPLEDGGFPLIIKQQILRSHIISIR